MPNDPLKFASDALGKAIDTEKRNRKLLDSIGPAIIQALRPTLERIESAVSRIKVDVKPQVVVNPEVKMPNINIPDVIVPEIHVPTPIVNYTPPAINIPKIDMPDEMNIKGWVSLMGVDLEHPLPVQLRNADGSPFSFDGVSVSGGSGGMRHVIVDNFSQIGGSGGLTDAELRASSVDVSQVSGATWSVSVASQGITLDTKQLSGSIDSVNILTINGVTPSVGSGASDTGTLRVILAANSIDSTQTLTDNVANNDTPAVMNYNLLYDGSTWDRKRNVAALGDGGTSADAMGLYGYQASASNWDRLRMNAGESTGALRVTFATDATASVTLATAISDVTDTIGTQQVSGAIDSSQVKLIARQTNPTAASDAASNFATSDDLGRTLVRPIQVRDLILTAYGSSTTGIETTLITASAGTYADCIMLTATNASSAAVQVDIRNTAAGNIVHTFYLPATTGPVGWSPSVPWPQDATGNAWTWDVAGSDVSGTSVYISGLFSREI